ITSLATEAGKIVSEVLGCSIQLVRPIQRGHMTFKCLVETKNSGRFVVRFYPPTRASVVDCEPDLLKRCYRAGMLVPQVVIDSRTGPKAKLFYVAYHLIEGETLSNRLPNLSSEQQKTVAIELAELVFDLSRIEFDGYGELLSCEVARNASWHIFVDASFRF